MKNFAIAAGAALALLAATSVEAKPTVGGSIRIDISERRITCTAWATDQYIHYQFVATEDVYISPFPLAFENLPPEERKAAEEKWVRDRMLPIGAQIAGRDCVAAIMGVPGIPIIWED
jgi:hypothetical protein